MKRAYIILICCFGAAVAGAQSFEEEELSSSTLDRVQAQRAAFITQKMDMTSGEAEKFWPLYNEYEKEERRIRREYLRHQKPVIDMTNEEARAFLLDRFDMEQKLLDLKRRYFLQLAEIVSPRKLAGFTRADREFKKLLLERLRANQRRGRN